MSHLQPVDVTKQLECLTCPMNGRDSFVCAAVGNVIVQAVTDVEASTSLVRGDRLGATISLTSINKAVSSAATDAAKEKCTELRTIHNSSLAKGAMSVML